MVLFHIFVNIKIGKNVPINFILRKSALTSGTEFGFFSCERKKRKIEPLPLLVMLCSLHKVGVFVR